MPDRVRDKRDRPWSWFDDEVITLYGRDLGPYGIAVYMAILTFADSKNRTCFPSMKQIAEMTAMSRRQTINSVKKLEGLKLIKKRQRYDVGQEPSSNLYTILTPGGSEYRTPGSEYHSPCSAPPALGSEYNAPHEEINVANELDEKVVNTVHQVVHMVHLGSAYGAPELDVKDKDKEKDKNILLDSAPAESSPVVKASSHRKQPKPRPQIPEWSDDLSWPDPYSLIALYHARKPESWSAIKHASDARLQTIKNYLTQFPQRDFWENVFQQLNMSRWLRDELNDRRLDWLLQKGQKDRVENCVKVDEGKYRDRADQPSPRYKIGDVLPDGTTLGSI